MIDLENEFMNLIKIIEEFMETGTGLIGLCIVGFGIMIIIGYSTIFIAEKLKEINKTFKEFIEEIKGK